MSNNTNVCEKCNTPLVPSKDTNYNGTTSYDGAITYGNMVCPKCNPELVK